MGQTIGQTMGQTMGQTIGQTMEDPKAWGDRKAQPEPGPGPTRLLQSAEVLPGDSWRTSRLSGQVGPVKSVWPRPARPHHLSPGPDSDEIYIKT